MILTNSTSEGNQNFIAKPKTDFPSKNLSSDNILATCSIVSLNTGLHHMFCFSKPSPTSMMKWEILPPSLSENTPFQPKSAIDFSKQIATALFPRCSKNAIHENSLVTLIIRQQTWFAHVIYNTLIIKVPQDCEHDKDVICCLLEMAEEILKVERVLVCLQKESKSLGSDIRTFMFVGFEVIHPSIFLLPGFVCIGYQIE